MKNFFLLMLSAGLISSLYSCKKADISNDMSPASSSTISNIIQSAPDQNGLASRTTPGGGYNIGLLSEWLILGTQNTEVHLEEDLQANGGKVGAGPAGKFKLEDDGVINGNVYLHSGVKIVQMAGTINGSFNQNQNLASLDALLNRVSDTAANFTPTVTLNDVTNSTTILGNGTMNVINMHKLTLDHNETLVLSGNVNELFIINIADGMTLSSTAKIITAGGARSSHVLINILGHNKTATSTGTNLINATILAPDSQVSFGNVNGQIISGGSQIMTVDGNIYNYIPFGS